LFSAWDGDDDVVKGGTDTAAAVRREDRSVRDVVGRACENGAECANLANVITRRKNSTGSGKTVWTYGERSVTVCPCLALGRLRPVQELVGISRNSAAVEVCF
jgi:hypothetical protein